MVSGLTPPSKENDERKRQEEMGYMRDEIRFAPSSRNTSDVGGFFGTDSKIMPALTGQFALNPTECIVSIYMTITENANNTTEIDAGDEITSTVNAWKGKLVWMEDDRIGSNIQNKRAVFEPTNTNTFSNATQTFNKSGWAATYTVNSNDENVFVLKSASSIIKDINDGNPTIKTIAGTQVNGTLTTIKPAEGRTLTLATGGNIDISSNVTIADNEFGILQFFDDAGGKFLLVKTGSGGGSGADTNLSNLTTTGEAHFDSVYGRLIVANTWAGITTFTTDVKLASKIKSSTSTECGFQVTNDSISLGTEGTMQIPYKYDQYGSNDPSSSTIDGWFGNYSGCIGIYERNADIRIYTKNRLGGWNYHKLDNT